MSDWPRTTAPTAMTATRWHGLVFTALVLAASAVLPAAASAEEAAAAASVDAPVITSHGISAFGDLKYPADFRHFDYVNPDAPKGGTMSFRGTGASQTFDSLNNFILKGEPAQGLGLIYDTLLAGSDDEPDSSYGLVAASIEYPEDRSWVIFNLRPEAKFSDGVPVTAEDVVFSYNVLIEKGAPVYQITLQDITGAEALDPHRVKFTFRPEAPKRDLPQLAGGLPVLPKHYYDTVDFAASTLTPPIGSGPYVIEAVQAGKSVRYCRNTDYWGRDLPVNVGANNFGCVIYQYFADNNAAFEALKVGEYFFHEEMSSALWATSYNFPALEKGWVTKAEVPDGRPGGTQGFWMNLRRDKFKDQRVREAIGLMFNFEWTNQALFHGLNQRTTSFWMNSPMAASGLPEGEELAALEPFRAQLPPEIFTEPAWTPPVQKPDRLDRASLRKASKLLGDAGWRVGPGGMRVNDKGQTLQVAFVDDNASFEPIINTFVTNLRQVGIDASYRQIDAAQMQERQKNFDYDIAVARFVMSLSPSLELRQFFSSQSANTPGTVNMSGLADPVVDALVEKIIASTSRDEMVSRVRALDRVLRQKQIWVSNWYRPYHWLAYWDVFGMPPAPPTYSRGDAYWWFDQAKFDKLKAEGALR
ncbi:microcin C transport system substrate-binding protein [Amaricoccus macauensis]|uniref:Microcin C transport system substrate-binding protein n=1 Tax=Amaricoccus macauensis TaxID=57001 RepID=A0A840SME8_9RHOB|nr:extracellular solute-binding protein [Amaricoccus macauensis]MBB5222164.1 microcin C transport system substrate-binding protein [Amaricoccus macauensis]